MVSQNHLDAIREIIDSSHQVLITTHVNPDGDAIGSEMALARYLGQIGKSVKIINSSPTPSGMRFLDPRNAIEVFDEDRHIEDVTAADAVFILDISDWARLQDLGKLLKKMHYPRVCIDHHPAQNKFVDIDAIYPKASSTGELIYDCLKAWGAKLNMRICEAMYTAVMTDTGGFRFSNTSPRVHEIAADFLRYKVSPNNVYAELYENQPIERVKLMGEVAGTIETSADGRAGWVYVTQDMLRKTGATLKDTDGFSDLPRTIEGIEVALFFAELEDPKVKVSFRSKGRVVINEVARKFDGGGHKFAAGATIKGKLPDVMESVIREITNLLNPAG